MAGSLQSFSKQKGRGRRSFKPDSQINVTPLVDVMLVLLIVFMVTAPMLNVGVPVDLPKTQAARMNDQIEPVIVTVNAEGQLFLQETPLSSHDLVEKLKILTHNNPDAKVYVRGDQKIAYGKVMETMGLIAQAGFHKVSLIAEMPAGAIPQQNIPPKPHSFVQNQNQSKKHSQSHPKKA